MDYFLYLDVKVAGTLHELGRCIRESGNPVEAETHFKRGTSCFIIVLIAFGVYAKHFLIIYIYIYIIVRI